MKELNQSLNIQFILHSFVNSALINKEKEPRRSSPTSNDLVWKLISHEVWARPTSEVVTLEKGVLHWPLMKRLIVWSGQDTQTAFWLELPPNQTNKIKQLVLNALVPKKKTNANKPSAKHTHHGQCEYVPWDQEWRINKCTCSSSTCRHFSLFTKS